MKHENSPARDYLEQFASVGVYDSSGTFTVGEKAALEKLGAFQLPREAAWILKVVQSAVSWGAADIDVKQRRSFTSFAFAREEIFDLDAVQLALTSTDYSGPEYVQHLAVGLRAAGFGQWRHFELNTYSRDNRRRSLRWDGETLSADEATGKANIEGCVVELRVDFTVDGKARAYFRSKDAIKEAAGESAELSTRAAVCPIPLRLDGRRLDVLTSPELSRESSKVAKLGIAWSDPADTESTGLHLPSGVDMRPPRLSLKNRILDSRVFLLDGNRKERASEFILALNYHYNVVWRGDAYQVQGTNQASRLHGVWDGVVCDSMALARSSSTVKADLYFSAKGLSTDISGLALIQEGDELTERRASAKDFASAAIDRLDRKLSYHQGPYLKLGGLLGAGGLLLSIFGGPLALTFGIIFSPALVAGGVEMARANALMKVIVHHCRMNLQSLKVSIDGPDRLREF